MSGGGMGNADPRMQRNPTTASPFGGSLARPEPIDYEAPQPGQPYMGVGIQPMLQPMPQPSRVPYGAPAQQPYGMPMQEPYGMSGPIPIGAHHQKDVPAHTHGENGEIIQEFTGGLSSAIGISPQLQAQLEQDATYKPVPFTSLARTF